MPKAIILSHSFVFKDPRPLRQIRWLREAGFTDIVTVGLGPKPTEADSHFEIGFRGLIRRYLGYLIRDHEARFRYFFGRELDAIPMQFLKNADVLVLNEIEYLNWRRLSEAPLVSLPVYLDLHEDHVNDAHRGPLERIAFKKYWDWQLRQFVEFVTSRKSRLELTCVERNIADDYSSISGKRVRLIFNAPDENDLLPSDVQPERIKLIHHGMGTKGRGIETAVEAVAKLPENYSLDLVLFASRLYKLKVKMLAKKLGVARRVRLENGVPLTELPSRLNQADIAVVVLSTVTSGHINSLPNKFFESIHAKLAIVTGPNPSMARLTQEHGFGVSLPSWSSSDLADAILHMTPHDIAQFKSKAVEASTKLSSKQSRATFLEVLRDLQVLESPMKK